MSDIKQEVHRPAKILIIVHENNLSNEIQSRISQLISYGIPFDIKEVQSTQPIREREKDVVSTINSKNYSLVVVDTNVNLPIWAITDQCSRQLSNPKFYLEGTLSQILSRELNFNNFSGVLAIRKDKKTLFKEAYKDANQYHDKNIKIPNTLKTRFNIASLTKKLTAVGVIQMAKEKSIQLGQTVDEILQRPVQELVLENYPHKEIFHNFTLHELLTHTSGLKGGAEEPFFGTKMMFFEQLSQFLPWIKSYIQDPDLAERQKAKQHDYSNVGFSLLGFAIEAITGKSYYQYIQNNVLEPAGMMETVPQRDGSSIYAMNHTLMPENFFLGGNETSIEEILNQTEKMKHGESNPEILNLVDEFQIILETLRNLHQEYPKIKAILNNLERMIATNPQDFLKLKEEYAIKIEEIYSDLQTKYPNLLEIAEKLDATFGEWMERNHEWIEQNKENPTLKNILFLRELFAPNNLPAHFEWPYNALGSLIVQFSIASPAGKWYSTPDDLLKFNEALWDKEGKLADCGKSLISHPIFIRPGDQYGYGTAIRFKDELTAIGHTGKVDGACSSSFHYPKLGFTVVTLVNDDNSVQLGMAFNGIERHLVHGSQNGIVYFDPSLNKDTEILFIEEALLTKKTSSVSEQVTPHQKASKLQTTTAKLFRQGIADGTKKAPLVEENSPAPSLTDNENNNQNVQQKDKQAPDESISDICKNSGPK